MTQTGTESSGGNTSQYVTRTTQNLSTLEREIEQVRTEEVLRRVFIALYVTSSTVCQLACGALIVYLTGSA